MENYQTLRPCVSLLWLTRPSQAPKIHLGWSDDRWKALNTGVTEPTRLWGSSEAESHKQHPEVLSDACDCIFNVVWKQVPPWLHAKAVGSTSTLYNMHTARQVVCLWRTAGTVFWSRFMGGKGPNSISFLELRGCSLLFSCGCRFPQKKPTKKQKPKQMQPGKQCSHF